MTTTRIYQVILIDDEHDQMASFKDLAANADIEITSFGNAQDGLVELAKNGARYDGVILDAWTFRNADDKDASNVKALRDCINELNRLEHKESRIYPHCVYTGHYDDVNEQIEDSIPVYKKGEDQQAVFSYLKEQVDLLPTSKIISTYPEPFSVFTHQLLPDEKRAELVRILAALEGNDLAEQKANMSLIRTFVEAIAQGLNVLGEQYFPATLMAGQRINQKYASLYLSGRAVQLRDRGAGAQSISPPEKILPDHLQWMFSMLLQTSSSAGAHQYSEKVTSHTYHTLAHALCELIVWYKDFVLSKQP